MADNLNISPDMINNLVNMLKNNDFSNKSNDSNQNQQYSNNSNNSPNFQYTTDSSVNQNMQSETDSSTSHVQSDAGPDSSNSSTNIDFETILKMKSMMETLNNSNDQDSKLLYSLKPYLRKSRQAKLDQYINILKITQVSKLFGSKS